MLVWVGNLKILTHCLATLNTSLQVHQDSLLVLNYSSLSISATPQSLYRSSPFTPFQLHHRLLHILQFKFSVIVLILLLFLQYLLSGEIDLTHRMFLFLIQTYFRMTTLNSLFQNHNFSDPILLWTLSSKLDSLHTYIHTYDFPPFNRILSGTITIHYRRVCV